MACFRYAASLALDGASMPFAEPGVEPNYAPSWTFRIVRIDVFLSIDPAAHTWKGRSRITLRPLPAFDGTVRLDLDAVEVEAVATGEGAPLPWRIVDGAIEVLGVRGSVVEIRYAGSEPRAGIYFTGPTTREPERQQMAWTQCQDEDAHFLMPCLDHPRVKHPWSTELEGPEGHTLLSNGEKTAGGVRDGKTWSTWNQADPMPAYLFTAVVAKLTTVEDALGDLPVSYLVPVGSEAHVTRAMGRTPQMIRVFGERTGVPYPWPRYDQVIVHDFVFGGMENTACTTMTDLLLVDEKVGEHWPADGLVSHELAHQWFGDLVTCQDWSQAWLNEAFATFFEVVWWEHSRSPDEATWYAWSQARAYMEEDGGRYRRPITSYNFRAPIDVFDRHLYEKGSVVLRTLRGELGETAFWAGVRLYLERHAHSTVHGRDLRRAFEDASGRNLDRFFHQWILGAGHPNLKVRLAEESGLLTVTVTQQQTGAETAEAFHLGLRLDLVALDGGTRSIRLPVAERERTWAIPLDEGLSHVRVDPGFQVLASVSLDAPVAWLERLAVDGCPVLSARAIKALVEKNTRHAIRLVASALTDHPFYGVRAEAARLLGARGGADSRELLLGALSEEIDPRVTVEIAGALGSWREAGVADALMAALDAGPSTWHAQGALLHALGSTRDPRARGVLEAALAVDSWGDHVRQRALLGLAHTHDRDVLPVLLAHTTDAHSDRARGAAANALGILADRVDSVQRPAVDRLLEMLAEESFRATLAAISGLGTIKSPRALEALERLHRSAVDGRTQRMAYEAMVKIRSGRTTEAGLSTVREELDKVRAESARLRTRIDRMERQS